MAPYRERQTEVDLEELARATRRPLPRVVALRGVITLAIVLALCVVASAALLLWPRRSSLPEAGRQAPAESAAPSAMGIALPAPSSTDEERARDALKSLGTTECREELAVHCGGRCPSYAAAWARAVSTRASKVPCHSGGVTKGSCGTFRFVSSAGGYGGTTEYFGASGEMVGAEVFTDYLAFCGGRSFSIRFGVVPDCEARVEHRICARSTERASAPCVPGDPLCAAPTEPQRALP